MTKWETQVLGEANTNAMSSFNDFKKTIYLTPLNQNLLLAFEAL